MTNNAKTLDNTSSQISCFGDPKLKVRATVSFNFQGVYRYSEIHCHQFFLALVFLPLSILSYRNAHLNWTEWPLPWNLELNKFLLNLEVWNNNKISLCIIYIPAWILESSAIFFPGYLYRYILGQVLNYFTHSQYYWQ